MYISTDEDQRHSQILRRGDEGDLPDMRSRSLDDQRG